MLVFKQGRAAKYSSWEQQQQKNPTIFGCVISKKQTCSLPSFQEVTKQTAPAGASWKVT